MREKNISFPCDIYSNLMLNDWIISHIYALHYNNFDASLDVIFVCVETKRRVAKNVRL